MKRKEEGGAAWDLGAEESRHASDGLSRCIRQHKSIRRDFENDDDDDGALDYQSGGGSGMMSQGPLEIQFLGGKGPSGMKRDESEERRI